MNKIFSFILTIFGALISEGHDNVRSSSTVSTGPVRHLQGMDLAGGREAPCSGGFHFALNLVEQKAGSLHSPQQELGEAAHSPSLAMAASLDISSVIPGI